MNQNDLQLLGVPQSISQIIPDVQNRTGISVEFCSLDDAAKASLGEFGKANAVLDVDARTQTIKIWLAPGTPRAHTITHELLHVRRNVLEGKPRWFPTVDAPAKAEAFVNFVQNDLEHLSIIREEIDLHPEAQASWDSHYEETIERAAERQDHFAIAMHWAFLRTTMPESNRAMLACAERVRRLPSVWLQASMIYQHKVKDALHDPLELMAQQIALVRDVYPDDARYFMRGKYSTEGGRLNAVCLTDF